MGPKVQRAKLWFKKILKQVKWILFLVFNKPNIIYKTSSGYWIQVERSDKVARDMFFGTYEPEESRIIQEYVKPGSIALDVGAHIGYFTLLMAQLVGADGKVFAFEPNPAVFSKLKYNLALNPAFHKDQVYLYPVAVGREKGIADFYCPFPGSEGVGGLQDTHRALVEKKIQVEVVPLDVIMKDALIRRVDFVKMDIEGGELSAFMGATEMLFKCRPVILFEAFEKNTEAYGYRVFELMAFLENLGYITKQIGWTHNILAIPR